nr:ABC transporter B family member 20 isoform X2 [Ipomoea batatas]GME03625.1 ABC transporter B family member 20 isoform X2 [Ipomoea batatas]
MPCLLSYCQRSRQKGGSWGLHSACRPSTYNAGGKERLLFLAHRRTGATVAQLASWSSPLLFVACSLDEEGRQMGVEWWFMLSVSRRRQRIDEVTIVSVRAQPQPPPRGGTPTPRRTPTARSSRRWRSSAAVAVRSRKGRRWSSSALSGTPPSSDATASASDALPPPEMPAKRYVEILKYLNTIAQKLWLAGFSKGIQEMHRKASLVLEDAVRNIYTVVAFCAGNKVMELYRLQLRKIFKKSFLHGMAIGFGFGFSQFLLFGCNALLLWYIALSVKRGHVNLHTALKEYMVFSFATFALVEPFGLAPYILKRRKSLTSVFEIIDRVPRIEPDDDSALKPPNVYGSIELKSVDFSYPTRPEILVLSNFSLKVNGGQTVAVVGVSGSGKSTIISLIQRFYDPIAGQVLLDSRDLKSYNLRWLRNHLGLVQQEPIVFSTTIRENIIYARHNASEAEMKEAARIANAHHFISSLPHGYDTHVGMRGVDLTLGQKQRIAIARVVLKNAPILLLDEASSSIESESSRVVQEALDTLIMGKQRDTWETSRDTHQEAHVD